MTVYSSSATSIDLANKEDKLKALIAKITAVAAKEVGCDNDDFMVEDYAGGNIDDAYQIGTDHGEVLFARELLELLS